MQNYNNLIILHQNTICVYRNDALSGLTAFVFVKSNFLITLTRYKVISILNIIFNYLGSALLVDCSGSRGLRTRNYIQILRDSFRTEVILQSLFFLFIVFCSSFIHVLIHYSFMSLGFPVT